MYLIILTFCPTLHAHGTTTIATARDASKALRPLAGDGSYLLFSLGLIGMTTEFQWNLSVALTMPFAPALTGLSWRLG